VLKKCAQALWVSHPLDEAVIDVVLRSKESDDVHRLRHLGIHNLSQWTGLPFKHERHGFGGPSYIQSALLLSVDTLPHLTRLFKYYID